MQSTSISSVSQKLEVHDELDVRNKPELRNQLDIDEKVVFSATLTKINKRLDEQERILLITNRCIYNIQPESNLLTKVAFFIAPNASVKRKVALNKVWGFTISSYHLSEQFVIHISDDYDYRYDGKGKKEKVLRCLCSAYFRYVNNQFPIYIREEQDLAHYQTTDVDFKQRIDRKPKDGKILINREILDKGLTWIISNRIDLMNQTSLQTNSASGFNRASSLSSSNQNPMQYSQNQNQPMFDSSIPLTTSIAAPQQNIPVKQNDNVIDYRQGTNPFQQFVAPNNNSNQINQNNQGYQSNQVNQVNQGNQAHQGLQHSNSYNPQAYNTILQPSPNDFVPPQTSYNPIEDLVRADWAPVNQNTNINFNVNLSFEANGNTGNTGDNYNNNHGQRLQSHFPS